MSETTSISQGQRIEDRIFIAEGGGMAKKQLEFMSKYVLKRLWNSNASGAFQWPVDPVLLKVPDYYFIIKNPMDLSTIKGKFKKYRNARECVDDLRLMFANCYAFNHPTDPVTACGRALERELDQMLEKLPAGKTSSKGRKRKLSETAARWSTSVNISATSNIFESKTTRANSTEKTAVAASNPTPSGIGHKTCKEFNAPQKEGHHSGRSGISSMHSISSHYSTDASSAHKNKKKVAQNISADGRTDKASKGEKERSESSTTVTTSVSTWKYEASGSNRVAEANKLGKIATSSSKTFNQTVSKKIDSKHSMPLQNKTVANRSRKDSLNSVSPVTSEESAEVNNKVSTNSDSKNQARELLRKENELQKEIRRLMSLDIKPKRERKEKKSRRMTNNSLSGGQFVALDNFEDEAINHRGNQRNPPSQSQSTEKTGDLSAEDQYPLPDEEEVDAEDCMEIEDAGSTGLLQIDAPSQVDDDDDDAPPSKVQRFENTGDFHKQRSHGHKSHRDHSQGHRHNSHRSHRHRNHGSHSKKSQSHIYKPISALTCTSELLESVVPYNVKETSMKQKHDVNSNLMQNQEIYEEDYETQMKEMSAEHKINVTLNQNHADSKPAVQKNYKDDKPDAEANHGEKKHAAQTKPREKHFAEQINYVDQLLEAQAKMLEQHIPNMNKTDKEKPVTCAEKPAISVKNAASWNKLGSDAANTTSATRSTSTVINSSVQERFEKFRRLALEKNQLERRIVTPNSTNSKASSINVISDQQEQLVHVQQYHENPESEQPNMLPQQCQPQRQQQPQHQPARQPHQEHLHNQQKQLYRQPRQQKQQQSQKQHQQQQHQQPNPQSTQSNSQSIQPNPQPTQSNPQPNPQLAQLSPQPKQPHPQSTQPVAGGMLTPVMELRRWESQRQRYQLAKAAGPPLAAQYLCDAIGERFKRSHRSEEEWQETLRLVEQLQDVATRRDCLPPTPPAHLITAAHNLV